MDSKTEQALTRWEILRGGLGKDGQAIMMVRLRGQKHGGYVIMSRTDNRKWIYNDRRWADLKFDDLVAKELPADRIPG